MKQLVLSSITQFAEVIHSNPSLSDLPVFRAMKPAVDLATSAKSCGCGQAKKQAKLQEARQMFEVALANITPADLQSVKSALNLDSLCYFSRNKVTGSLDKLCI